MENENIKLAYCPVCDAELDDVEYLGQFCETCLWTCMEMPADTVDTDRDTDLG